MSEWKFCGENGKGRRRKVEKTENSWCDGHTEAMAWEKATWGVKLGIEGSYLVRRKRQ